MSERTNKEKMVPLTSTEKINSLMDSIDNRIKHILQEASDKYDSMQNELEEANRKLEEATARLEESDLNDDLTSYKEAYHEVNDLKATIDFYISRMEAKKSGALLSKSDCNEMQSNLRSAFAELELANAKRILPLLEEIRNIGTEELRIWERASALYNRIDSDMLRKDPSMSYLDRTIVAKLPTMELTRQLTPSSAHYFLADWMESYASAIKDGDSNE